MSYKYITLFRVSIPFFIRNYLYLKLRDVIKLTVSRDKETQSFKIELHWLGGAGYSNGYTLFITRNGKDRQTGKYLKWLYGGTSNWKQVPYI